MHLDAQQKVDSRGVEVLRLGACDERRPGSVALDRRELHTPMFGHSVEVCFNTGNALQSHSANKKTPENPTRSARGRTSNLAAVRGLACDG